MKPHLYFFLPCFLFPVIAHAQLTECNGVWQNKPCETGSAKSIEEKQYVEPSAEVVAKQQSLEVSGDKRRAVGRLRTQATLAERDIEGFTFSTDAVERYCDDANVTVTQCYEKVEAATARLESRVDAAKSRELKEEENKIASQQNDDTTVVVVEQRYGWRHRHRGERCRKVGATIVCDPQPEHYRRSTGSAGISVGLEGDGKSISGNSQVQSTTVNSGNHVTSGGSTRAVPAKQKVRAVKRAVRN